MAGPCVTPGPFWDEFIGLMPKEGRYGSTNELIRALLRLMECLQSGVQTQCI